MSIRPQAVSVDRQLSNNGPPCDSCDGSFRSPATLTRTTAGSTSPGTIHERSLVYVLAAGGLVARRP